MKDFANRYSSMCPESLSKLTTTASQQFTCSVRDSLTKKVDEFTCPREAAASEVRWSQLGKPAVLLALDCLGFKEPHIQIQPTFGVFLLGDFYETYTALLLPLLGYEILEQQTEVELYGVKGHIDFLVKDTLKGGTYLVECKSLSENYLNKFVKAGGEEDSRGYATQLAAYRAATEVDKAYWILWNKSSVTPTTLLLNEDSPYLGLRISRASKVLEALLSIKTLEDILEYFQPPPPEPEYYRKKETGRLLVPTSMKYSLFRNVFYDTLVENNGYGKPTEYVVEVRETINEEVLNEVVGKGQVPRLTCYT